ncbi:VPS28 protein-domain-containing protein [Kalaharituber pfeilii]|nr:VPS28 protein-domain-containing protein [Kalaharituber pfeilii]
MSSAQPKYHHQPYAPSPYSYTPNPSLSSQVSLDEEIKLSTTVQQRELNESLAEIFSIIVTLDFVEKAYVKDTITQEEYTITCSRLLGQYKTILKNPAVASAFVDLDTFKREYKIGYPTATERLKIGVPATFEQPVHNSSTSAAPITSAKAAAEATQHFITFMDALRLNYNAKDQLHPLLSDVITAVNNVTTKDFEGRGRIVKWLIELNRMGAGDEINEGQRRQMLFDIENAYHEFYKTLG